MPAKPRSFVAVVKATERSLRAARVEHVFVGALAVSAFGVPRTTTDVGVIVEYGEEDAPRMAESFRRQSFKVRMEDLRDARAEGPTARCMTHSPPSTWRSLRQLDRERKTRSAISSGFDGEEVCCRLPTRSIRS